MDSAKNLLLIGLSKKPEKGADETEGAPMPCPGDEAIEEFFRESLKMHPHILDEMHHIPAAIAYLPTVMMAVGFLVSWLFYIQRPYLPVELAGQHPLLYKFLLNKWYFDELYDLIFVRPAFWLGRLFWKGGDGKIIDGLGPDGISALVGRAARRLGILQSGYLYHYAFAMIIGIAGVVTWMVVRAGGFSHGVTP